MNLGQEEERRAKSYWFLLCTQQRWLLLLSLLKASAPNGVGSLDAAPGALFISSPPLPPPKYDSGLRLYLLWQRLHAEAGEQDSYGGWGENTIPFTPAPTNMQQVGGCACLPWQRLVWGMAAEAQWR